MLLIYLVSGPGSNGNEGILHIPQCSRTRVSPSDGLLSYARHSLGWKWEALPHSRNTIIVFYSLSCGLF